jgi:hypothetical protein
MGLARTRPPQLVGVDIGGVDAVLPDLTRLRQAGLDLVVFCCQATRWGRPTLTFTHDEISHTRAPAGGRRPAARKNESTSQVSTSP